MSEKNTGGPAFPFPVLHGKGAPAGMTLRDYFAAKAMQAILTGMETRGASILFSDLGFQAYKTADAMLEMRDDKPTG